MDDGAIVAAQIGRPPRSATVVAVRCHLGMPTIVDVPPILDDGTPFPTTYWLTCPLATVRIARLESTGGVREAEELIATDPHVALRYAAAMSRYADERDARIPPDWDGPRPRGGVAGALGGVKCLHAHYADTASGHDNPIGERVAGAIEPLDCDTACVTMRDGAVVRNPGWQEPR